MDETTDISSEYTVDFHRHCQGTILSVYGHQGDGRTTDIFRLANFVNFPSTWREDFFNRPENKTLTHDLASILELVDRVVGELKQRIVTEEEVKFNLSFKDNNGREITSCELKPLVHADTNYTIQGFGRDITLKIAGQTVSFNTVTRNDDESDVFEVDLPRSNLIFKVGDQTTDSISLPMSEDATVQLPNLEDVKVPFTLTFKDNNGTQIASGELKPYEDESTTYEFSGFGRDVDLTIEGQTISFNTMTANQNDVLSVTLPRKTLKFMSGPTSLGQVDLPMADNLTVYIPESGSGSSSGTVVEAEVQEIQGGGTTATIPVTPGVSEYSVEVTDGSQVEIDIDSYSAAESGILTFDIHVLNNSEQDIVNFPAPTVSDDGFLVVICPRIPIYPGCVSVVEFKVDLADKFVAYHEKWQHRTRSEASPLPYLTYNHRLRVITGVADEGIDLGDVVDNYAHGVAEAAFKDNQTLTSIRLPNAADGNEIGTETFKGCTSLVSVDIPGIGAIGESAFEGCSSLRTITLPTSAPDIGENAFKDCTSLSSVEFEGPRCVSRSATHVVGSYAFDGCRWLDHVKFPDGYTQIGSYAFNGCLALDKVSIPDSVTGALDETIFSGCTGLQKVSIGKNVTSIPTGLLSACENLHEITLPVNLASTRANFRKVIGGGIIYQTIKKVTFNEGNGSQLTLPTDNYLLFEGCEELIEVSIPPNVTAFKSSYQIFKNLPKLKKVTIPFVGLTPTSTDASALFGKLFDNTTTASNSSSYDSARYTKVTMQYYTTGSSTPSKLYVKVPKHLQSVAISAKQPYEIPYYAFCGAYEDVNSLGFSSINEIIIGDNVTEVGDSAFSGCSGLTSLTISDDVQTIGTNAFSGCNGLTIVNITDIAKWCGITFGAGSLVGTHDLYLNGEKVTELTIPDGVSSIKTRAFSGCNGLTSVTIPESVTSIGSESFYGCSGLTNVTIGDNVKSIGSYAFTRCSGLTSVTIPDSVTSIGEQAFYNCSGLTSVYITDVAKWCELAFTDTCANPLHYAHNLYVNGEKVWGLTIPEGVSRIGYAAFYNCTSIYTVVVPNSVTSIGNLAFSGCSICRWFIFSCSSVPTLENVSAFNNTASDMQIIVPDGLYDDWIAASNWSNIAQRIIRASDDSE